MAKAMKHLWNLSQDEILREYLEAIDKKERDRISREDWVRKESMQKGRQEGRQEGMQEGMQKGRQSVVLEMLKKKLNISTIMECTGISKEEVLEIQKKADL